ncbi:DNA photolyase family protein [Streptomyces sp. NBC_01218]|uniref:cryptochrome/photolyase family protein n=1 Tax=Streptomyces sp. NBC_01218 TaxID=2903780 RepID=UPI002E12D2FA|nr:DNA photolyase family protein [Streptomyces sp. NBC_01218]
MTVSVVLFTADLRLHDQPPLRAAAAASEEIVPLFVVDRRIEEAGFRVPNRWAFLADCLRDLDTGLRERGGRLVIRTGDVAGEVCRVAAETGAFDVHMSAGVSAYAHAREERLRTELESQGRRLHVHDAVVTAVAPGTVRPAASAANHFAVFTPYFRRWSQERLRDPLPPPRAVRVPDAAHSGELPVRAEVSGVSPGLAEGGENAGRALFAAWRRSGLGSYDDQHDDLAGDATSRLSPHLHFGTVSPVELIERSREAGGTGAEAFVRQLCWREFHYQVLAARPSASHADYRSRDDDWRDGEEARDDIEAWRQGRTGYPVVDAAMRQLRHEGWMHNRGRLLTASFLAKTLYVDWRIGARHFLDLLVDGDIANNQLNWQWVAGTGTDSRPNRVLNPVLQSHRYDPDGAYVRRWVPELAGIEGAAVHEPWRLPEPDRVALDYPAPVIHLPDALARFKGARGLR